MKKWWLGLLALSFWGLAAQTKAAGQGTLTVTPPFGEVEIKPTDASQDFIFQIKNTNPYAMTFRLTVTDFGALDESGGVAFLGLSGNQVENKYALASWVSLEKDTVTVEVGQTQTVKATILNKESLSPGGHYGAITLNLESEGNGIGDQVKLNQTYAVLMYIKKIGGEKYNLTLNQMEWKTDWWKIDKLVNLRFLDAGNVHVVPRGKAVIVGSDGTELAKGIINSESAIILPESYRRFPVELADFQKWWWPGIYKLEVWYRYDGRDSFEVKKWNFIYYGKEGVILTLGLALAITGVVGIIIRKIGKKSR